MLAVLLTSMPEWYITTLLQSHFREAQMNCRALACCFGTVLMLAPCSLNGQAVSGSITGIVTDPPEPPCRMRPFPSKTRVQA